MTDEPVAAERCSALAAAERVLESYPNREMQLGHLRIARAMPIRDRRMVGPWCFLDRFGPLTFDAGKPMDVAPHPHIGLQTVTWMVAGEVLHQDSLGAEAVLRPGGVNVMTSGAGIAHAEQTPAGNSGQLNGVQLWVALPDTARHDRALFEGIAEVPEVTLPGGVARVFAGALGGASAPTTHFSPLLGADLEVHAGGAVEVPLDPAHEHAVLLLAGDGAFEGTEIEAGRLYYLGTRRGSGAFTSRAGGRLLLIGGLPFPEQILMWWNFVARTPEEIAQARADWEAHRRFGDVTGYRGPRLDAPALSRIARPNPVS